MALVRHTAGVLAAALLAAVAAPASAQVSTTANGPYLATPAWDQKLAINRFVVLANWNSEAVLDRETGLVWDRTPYSSTTFSSQASAALRCLNARTGGRRGWRLPRAEELMSVSDPESPAGSLPVGHPFFNVFYGTVPGPGGTVVPFGSFVSDTTYPGTTPLAGQVGFADGPGGGASIGGSSAGAQGVWCVRSGNGAGSH